VVRKRDLFNMHWILWATFAEREINNGYLLLMITTGGWHSFLLCKCVIRSLFWQNSSLETMSLLHKEGESALPIEVIALYNLLLIKYLLCSLKAHFIVTLKNKSHNQLFWLKNFVSW